MKSFITTEASQTVELGRKIGAVLKSGDCVLLTGDLSAGKTTITKGIGLAMGVKRIINSPTFTIVKTYKGDSLTLNHLDLYRLEGLNNDFDLEEYIEAEGTVTVIEWPYQVSEILPKEYLKINLMRTGENDRKIEVEGIGRYESYEEEIGCIR